MGRTTKATVAIIVLTGCIVTTGPSTAQTFPTKPGRLIVGVSPGGGVDVNARILAGKLSQIWGQQLVVDNRPGAGGTIASAIVAKATPDGYTLLMCNIGGAISAALYRSLPYDSVKDFARVSQIGTTPNVLVVHPTLPTKSVKEFVAYAKANPGKIIFASPGVGTSPHMTMELMRLTTAIDIVHVPYKGGAPALTELLGGQVHAMFDNLTTQLTTIKTGRVRALAVTSPKRSMHLPDTATMIESGFPIEVMVWYGICAPSGISRPILAKLNAV